MAASERMADAVADFRARGFLPPRYRVYPWDAKAGWAAVPALPQLTDPRGVRVITGAHIRFTADAAQWRIRAEIQGKPHVLPEVAPSSGDFWTQDHIEFRFLCGQGADMRQVQFILASSGRWWDNQGRWQREQAAVTLRVTRTPRGWTLEAALPRTWVETLPGVPVRGVAAWTRWEGGRPQLACSAPVELGYGQSERFGEWFATPAAAVRLDGCAAGGIALRNVSASPRTGRVRIVRQRLGGIEDAAVAIGPLRFKPGVTVVPAALEASSEVYTRHEVWFEEDGVAAEDLGGITRRVPLPAAALRARRHPRLLFDEAGLAAMRAKLKRTPFREVAGKVAVTADDLRAGEVPDKPLRELMAVTPKCMGWFRVAKESLLRDGAGGLKAPAARVWALQDEEARAAWRRVVADVHPDAATLTLLCGKLNTMLARRDFYDGAAFGRVALPIEGRTLLARGVNALSDEEIFRFNRIVLQSCIECVGAFRTDLATLPGRLMEKWLACGDDRLIAAATRAVRSSLRLTIFDHQIHLHEGMAAAGAALAYDAFYPALTAAERKIWQAFLLRFINLYIETAERRSWTVTTLANANPVGNSGCGLAALALLDSHPQIAQRALGFAREYVWIWLDHCNSPCGGNTEGAQYWQYGMENFIRFALALERVSGSDDGMLSHPAVVHTLNMVRVSLTNDGALCGVNDTIPMPIGGVLGWFAAGRFGDRFGLWYGDHAIRWLRAREAAGRPTAYKAGLAEMLLYRPAVPWCDETPALPVALELPGIAYTVLRSAPAWDSPWVAGLKGSRAPYTHHNQPDTGSFYLDYLGERMLIDPGYYKGEPECHSLPLIGGRGPCQPDADTGRILACGSTAEGLRYAACDATAAYGGTARRVVRWLVLGASGVVVLDDIDSDRPVTAQYQCGGPTKRLSLPAAWRIQGKRAALDVRLFGIDGDRPALAAERTLHDVHWGYHFADCRWFPVAALWKAKAPLVTVITAAGKAGKAAVTRRPGRIAVSLPDGHTVIFCAHADGWRLA